MRIKNQLQTILNMALQWYKWLSFKNFGFQYGIYIINFFSEFSSCLSKWGSVLMHVLNLTQCICSKKYSFRTIATKESQKLLLKKKKQAIIPKFTGYVIILTKK